MSEDHVRDDSGHAPSVPADEDERKGEVSRRSFLRWSAFAGAGASMAGAFPSSSAAAPIPHPEPAQEIVEATIAQLQAAMERGGLRSQDLVNLYLERIRTLDQRGPNVNSVIQINPEARKIAKARDKERKDGNVRGPLHGIPILLKDNIDTGDRMQTTAGSLALRVSRRARTPPWPPACARPARSSSARPTSSEWANFRASHSSSGWSGRGGQTRNPYVLDRNPCGSSSGSGAAVAANFAAARSARRRTARSSAPPSLNGVVGHQADRGPDQPRRRHPDLPQPGHRRARWRAPWPTPPPCSARSTGVDPRDPATAAAPGTSHTDYTQFLDPDGLRGARIGVARKASTGYSPRDRRDLSRRRSRRWRTRARCIVDPADIPTDELGRRRRDHRPDLRVQADLNAYLATRAGPAGRTPGRPDRVQHDARRAGDALLRPGDLRAAPRRRVRSPSRSTSKRWRRAARLARDRRDRRRAGRARPRRAGRADRRARRGPST